MVEVSHPSVQKWLQSIQGCNVVQHKFHEEIQSQLESLEFPHSKMEEWKYTRAQKLNQFDWKLQRAEVLSDPEFEQMDLVESMPRNTFFGNLNQMATTEAFFLNIPDHEVFDTPFHIVIKSNQDRAWTQPYLRIDIGACAQAKVVVHFMGAGQGLSNAMLDVLVAKNGQLDLDILEDNADTFFQLLDVKVDEEEDAKCNVVTYVLNGGWVRNNLWMSLNGERAHAGLSGFYLPQDGQLIDNHTVVDHRVPNCTSDELYKGVLYDKSRGVFNGKVFVRRDAQKTQAYQSNKNIMMSDLAVMDSKPELEIYADDVRCSHGSTTGQLDEEALFYLRARGLSEMGAKQLLVSAYVNEVILRSNNEEVTAYVKKELSSRGRIISDEV